MEIIPTDWVVLWIRINIKPRPNSGAKETIIIIIIKIIIAFLSQRPKYMYNFFILILCVRTELYPLLNQRQKVTFESMLLPVGEDAGKREP